MRALHLGSPGFRLNQRHPLAASSPPCIRRTRVPYALDMFSNWMKFSLNAARLGYEAQTVMSLRMLKLARAGKAAESEARRMVTEKGVAFAEAATTLATGGSMNKVVRRVRSRVSKNKRRLSRSSLSP